VEPTTILWIIFGLTVPVMLALDLGVFHRESHAVGTREALIWSAVWIGLSLAFGGLVWWWMGSGAAAEYVTAYIIEKSLSVDNIFVFLVIFSYFGIQDRYQHRVLFWGILTAVALRAVLIIVGVAVIERFQWLAYILGGVLIVTGLRMLIETRRQYEPGKNPVVRVAQRFLPVDPDASQEHFVVKKGGKWYGTPLVLVLVAIETTDVIFALDSIPAVIAVTRDPLIAFTSNIFAVLGLRALYFALAGIMGRFKYLHHGLALVLVLIGAKMSLEEVVHVPIGYTLGAVGLILLLSVVASLLAPPDSTEDAVSDGS
jgi:tellurite resistance protein TerC